MKRHLIYIYTLILGLTLVLGGCSKDDDVKIIFTGKVWKLSYIFRDGNPKAYINFWYEDRDAEAKSIEIQKAAGNYEVEFNGAKIDGVFTGAISGKVVNTTFNGTWKADGEKKSFSTSSMQWSGIEETDVLAQQFQKGLQNAFKYSGDANALYIYYKDGELINVIALLPRDR